jgi:hypothetical protein
LISCEAQAKAGEVFISPEVYRAIKRHFKGEGPFPSKNYRLDDIINPVPLPEPTEFPMLEILEQRLKAYVPPAVLSHLDGVRYATAEVKISAYNTKHHTLSLALFHKCTWFSFCEFLSLSLSLSFNNEQLCETFLINVHFLLLVFGGVAHWFSDLLQSRCEVRRRRQSKEITTRFCWNASST